MNRREVFGALGGLGAGLACGASAAHASEHQAQKNGGHTSPLAGDHLHFCGIHVAKNNPKFQIIVDHYCAAHTEGRTDPLFQCLLFESGAKMPKLLGVEYIITDKEYQTLSDKEKMYWHPHTYEVLGGGLIAPGMTPEKEMGFMKVVMNTWGKTWHTWPDPTTDVPIGEPMLVWSLTADGQTDEKVLQLRDRRYKVDVETLREVRGKEIGFDVPKVPFPKSLEEIGRQWTASGPDKPTKRNK